MQLNRGQIPGLARQIVKTLADEEHIEVVSQHEVVRDVESVLNQYVDDVDRVLSRARDLVQQRGLPQGEFGRIKQLAAEQAGIKLGDDGLEYLQGQVITMLMHSASVEEVFAEDHVLKRVIRQFLREEAGQEERLEAEVRSQLKHVKEGSRLWEIEYERMKADIKRRKGI